MKIKVVLEASEEGGYTVYVPSLPGCISEGDTEEEALANIREAIELYLEPVEGPRRRLAVTTLYSERSGVYAQASRTRILRPDLSGLRMTIGARTLEATPSQSVFLG